MVRCYFFPYFLFKAKYVLPLICLSLDLRKDLSISKKSFKKGGLIDKNVKILICVYAVLTRRGCKWSLQNKQGILFFRGKAKRSCKDN